MDKIKTNLKNLDKLDGGIETSTVNMIVGSRSLTSQFLINLAVGYNKDKHLVLYFDGLSSKGKIVEKYYACLVEEDYNLFDYLELSKLYAENKQLEVQKYELSNTTTEDIGNSIAAQVNLRTSFGDTYKSYPVVMIDSIIGIVPKKAYTGMTLYEQERQVMLELKVLARKYNTTIWVADFFVDGRDASDMDTTDIQGNKLKSQIADSVLLVIPNSGAFDVGLVKVKVDTLNAERNGSYLMFGVDIRTCTLTPTENPDKYQAPTIRVTSDKVKKSVELTALGKKKPSGETLINESAAKVRANPKLY